MMSLVIVIVEAMTITMPLIMLDNTKTENTLVIKDNDPYQVLFLKVYNTCQKVQYVHKKSFPEQNFLTNLTIRLSGYELCSKVRVRRNSIFFSHLLSSLYLSRSVCGILPQEYYFFKSFFNTEVARLVCCRIISRDHSSWDLHFISFL